jgi:hypothetical protein
MKPNKRVTAMRAVALAVVAAASLDGCGGKGELTAAQSRACWNGAISAFVPTLHKPGPIAPPYAHVGAVAVEHVLAADAVLFGEHQTIPGLSTVPTFTRFFRSTEAKCGRLGRSSQAS